MLTNLFLSSRMHRFPPLHSPLEMFLRPSPWSLGQSVCASYERIPAAGHKTVHKHQSGAMDQGKAIHCYKKDRAVEINTILGIALVEKYGKCRDIDSSKRIFISLEPKNVLAWNTVIARMDMHGQAHKVIQLLDEMCHRSPHRMTYNFYFCSQCRPPFRHGGKEPRAAQLHGNGFQDRAPGGAFRCLMDPLP